jgi:hypothetical protein
VQTTSGFSEALRKVQSRTVTAAFEDLLEAEINIAPGIRSTASDSHNHLREFLCSERDRDWTFPHILSQVDSDFLGGSFARHTKVWPLDDIDIYLPIDGSGLIYQNMFGRLPYTVLTDGGLITNPVLNSRWTFGIYVSSAKLINEFAVVLRRHYPRETKVYPNGTAVSIRMTQGETQTADGLGYDVVPCFALKPDDPNELYVYLIPDGKNGWMHTNPRIDTAVADMLQSFNNKLYRKIIKLVKYWNNHQFKGLFGSYYIELAISQVFWSRRSQNQAILSISEGLAVAFSTLKNAYASGSLTSWVKGAPPVEAPTLDNYHVVDLGLVADRAELARLYEEADRQHEAVGHWSKIFGPNFS